MKLAALLIIPILLITAALIGISTAREDIQPSIAQPIDSTTISSREELVSFVDHALAYVRDNGKEAALKEFNNRSGPFVEGDSYIIALDFNGTVLADPLRPWAVGRSEKESPDVNGVYTTKNFMNVASRGSGYAYCVNPCLSHNNATELKLAYVASVDGDLWLASSFPLANVSSNFSPDKRDTMVAFVDHARDYARARGKEEAMKAFNDRQGDFVLGDLYIYAYDFQGVTLVHPIQPQFLGKSRIDNQDPYGVMFIQDLRDLARNGGGLTYYVYPDPTRDMSPRLKLGYVAKVDDDWWLGSGIYADSEK